MKMTVQRPLLSKAVSGVKDLISKNSRQGKYTAIRTNAEDGLLTVSVSADDVVGQCVIDQNKVGDKSILNIIKSGIAVVDGQRHVRTIVEDTTSGVIEAEFKVAAGSKKPSKLDDDDEGGEAIDGDEAPEEDGTLAYSFPDDEKIGLQSVRVSCEPVIEPGTDKVVLKGSDFAKYAKFVKEYGGKSTMNPKWANTQITVQGKQVTFVVTNGYQLAFATFEADLTHEDMQVTVPTDMLAAMAKLANEEGTVTLSVKEGKDGAAGHLLMSQSIVYASAVVGLATFRIVTSTNKFISYSKSIDALSFKTTCKADIQSLRRACKRCDIVDRVRTKARLDVAKKLLHLFKQEDEAMAQGIKVQLLDAEGEEMELEISSRHIDIPAAQCEKEFLELKFSGQTTLALAILDENRKVYFPPFKEA